jgi:outer membrane protein TolC
MKIFGTILLVSAGLLSARAEDAGAVVISTDYINSLVAEARTNNPSLKAADARVRSATLNAEAVRTWEDPMAMIGGSTFSSRGFDPAQEGDLAYGIEQKLPLWGRPKLTRRAAQAEASMRQADVNYHVQQLRRDITKE